MASVGRFRERPTLFADRSAALNGSQKAFMAGVMTDPRVRFAIARAAEKRARRERRRKVEEALQKMRVASLMDLASLTELGVPDVAPVLDALRIAGQVEMDDGLFRWI